MATPFILRLRLSTEHHYAFKPSPCLKRVELPLNELIFNTIGIIRTLENINGAEFICAVYVFILDLLASSCLD
ncbi:MULTISPECIES: hypothetical protein [unclassified Shewanella]|uniref:hypothetical protein n=1 Tax=unclassified Shewanella TaxID=196818 RepID=UPI002035915D|nr:MULTISPECIES: hypothetical protein [unclassified Shewanella]MCU8085938.1 hypothetical protein [Shewanella sp. SM21]